MSHLSKSRLDYKEQPNGADHICIPLVTARLTIWGVGRAPQRNLWKSFLLLNFELRFGEGMEEMPVILEEALGLSIQQFK
ncbi:hypothetical protein DPEC_G00019130 [Dallia pectoralis]|uniref:Uncharacterized protein n=1 Tax=Dallia pectoralis TaxID=75939 RepID=A0ACC2HG91_DALPE|nr:hypothetical protein DPEC_G00019130 [Dallia pectoralis]